MFFVLSGSSLVGIYLEVVFECCEVDLFIITSSNNFAAIASLLSHRVKIPDNSKTLAYGSSE